MIVALLALALPSGAEDLTSSVGRRRGHHQHHDGLGRPDHRNHRPRPSPDRRGRADVDLRRRTDDPDLRPGRRSPTTDDTEPRAGAAADRGRPSARPLWPCPAAPSITVTPATGLVQGDVVTITGTGFPANTQLAFVQCIPGTGQEGCNLNNLVYVTSNPSGAFTRTFTPIRILRIAGVNHDCAVAGECRIGGGTVPDGSGGSATADDPVRPVDPTASAAHADGHAVDEPARPPDRVRRRHRLRRRNSYIGVVECLATPTTEHQRRLRLRDPAVRPGRQHRIVHRRHHRPPGAPRRRHAGRLRRRPAPA